MDQTVLCTKFMLFPLLPWLVLLASINRGDSYSLPDCEVHKVKDQQVKVLCFHMDLSRFPAQLPKKTTNLDISHNNIELLQKVDFHNITLLQIMNASANQIHHIEKGAFQKLGALQLLNLSSNRLDALTTGMFEGLQNLSTLLLADNYMATIEPGAFSNLPTLKILDLSSNRLYTLQAMSSIFQIRSLDEIYIRNNSLQFFSTRDILNASATLHAIDASRSPFSSISFITNALQNLTSLDISFSGRLQPVLWHIQEPCFLRGLKRLNMEGILMKPTALSSVIQNLSCTSLEEINIGYLNLTDSDSLIHQICSRHPKVKILYLQGNNYTGFKLDTFQNCTFLKLLNLSYNMFQHVPAHTFQHLSSLQQLSLANNLLTVLPHNLSHLTSLKSIDLGFNHLSEVFLNDSMSYSKLKHLSLIGNEISKFSSSSQSVWNLQDLRLGDNFLLDIVGSFSASLKMLQNLELRKNKLSLITSNTFKNLVSLKCLNLVDNQISAIHPGAFNGLENLQTLLLGSNKITSQVFQKNTFQGLGSLLELQLFSNYIAYDSSEEIDNPPFHLLTSLKILTLNSQGSKGMQNLPVNVFIGLVSLEKVHTGNLAISSLDPRTFSYTPQLKELDLSNNPLQRLDPQLLQPLYNLTELHINQMHLESLDFLIESKNFNLFLLRAAGNQLNMFTCEQLKNLPSLGFLDLRSNPLTCSCDNQWFIDWALQDMNTQVLHFYQYTCAYPPSSKGKKLFTFNIKSCGLDSCAFILFLSTTLFISNLLISLTVWHFWRWQVVYAYYILLAFLYDRKHQERKHKYQYDAFISYNCHDEEWVFSQLVSNLEENYGRKLCLHHRDFEPGKAILDNIVDSIYSSRKTICIISTHYLESEWCSKEIQVASYRLFDENADVLILVFLEDIPNHRLSPYHKMRKIIKKKTYLVWPREKNAAPVFWHKVNQALQTGEDEENENGLLPGVCL
ncbi:hypothetical protein FKM82_012325 [Ascaphus truei]